MGFVYTRLDHAPATGLLGGARGKRGDTSDIWRDLGFGAPARRMPAAPAQDGHTYILQQDPDGRWLVDHWHGSVGVPADPVSTCFIIELGHATQR
jgi:hypothetical protein